MPWIDLLDQEDLPAAGEPVTASAKVFKRWMAKCGYTEATANPNQEVFFVATGTPIEAEGKKITPNWHITAMTTLRDGGDCRNFHFKIEVAKEKSHYWHYVIYRDTATGSFHWVGDRGDNANNQGGGGASGSVLALAANLSQVESTARALLMDDKMSKKIQRRIIVVLSKMVTAGEAHYGNQRLD